MAQNASYLVDLSGITLSDGEAGKPTSSWVHALPIGSYNHPIFGKIQITLDRAKRFADSVVKKVRGIDPSINYNHNNNDVAAGWVKSAEARDNGVWLFVEWTEDAVAKIRSRAYRYFSAEFSDEWEDSQGLLFTDVIMGGALTNRPFMKNLVPVNLSEATLDNAFELVSAISGQDVESLKGGNTGMDEKDLNEIVEKVTAKLAEKFTPPAAPAQNSDNLNLSEVTELKQLAEENPLVAMLIRQVENQGVNIADAQKQLHEQEIQVRLAEFDRSKLVLTPVAKKLVYTLLQELPRTQHETFWQLMDNMRKSQAFLVDLSERSGVSVKYGMDRSPQKRFNELVNKELAAGVDYATAVEKVAAANRDLYDEYRQETFN